MNWNTFPKVVAEKIHIGFNQAFFLFGFESGSEEKAYVMPAAVAKSLIPLLTTKIAEYERMYGPVDTTTVESGISSPIQLQ